VLGEDALSEGVKRFDRGAIDLVECIRAPGTLAFGERRVACRAFKTLSNAIPQFSCGALRERNRRDGSEFSSACRDDPDDTLDQLVRLSGPGPGLDEERAVEVIADALPSCLISWYRRNHYPIGSARSR
jgi:hypothetical protein